MDRLCDPAISFLIGEKGTGKTAYSVYLANNDYKNTFASIRFVRETEYQKFVLLKREKHLHLSDYTGIWKTIIYLLMSQQVKAREGGPDFLQRFSKFARLQEAIDEYYSKAFSPEIVQALQFVQESKVAAELISKYAKVGGDSTETATFSESRFQANLFYIQKSFEDAFKQLRPKSNHILFIDGIDIRPASISYDEYLDCIRGLANAIWEVNNDLFPLIKGSSTRLRVVLLVRPDIFSSLGLQNLNTKSRDNSVFLDWRTDYSHCGTSNIFRVIDHLIGSQQDQVFPLGKAWDHYFPWSAPSPGIEKFKDQTSFVSFLRFSYYRPRDILTMLIILQDIARETRESTDISRYEDFDNPEFRRRYSDYLLGEIKDQLMFYYGSDEYEVFLKYFEFLDGKTKFTYKEYLSSFSRYQRAVEKSQHGMPPFASTPNVFLQFLYDLNVICYIEYPENDTPYFRWCFRERSFANIWPKVKEECTYDVFYGLHKALNVGQRLRGRKQ